MLCVALVTCLKRVVVCWYLMFYLLVLDFDLVIVFWIFVFWLVCAGLLSLGLIVSILGNCVYYIFDFCVVILT